MSKVKDLTGQRFGRLAVLNFEGVFGGYARWACVCDCGVEKTMSANLLRKDAILSCGCALREAKNAKKVCPVCKQLKKRSEFYVRTIECIPCKKLKDQGRLRWPDDRPGANTTPSARARKKRWLAKNFDPIKHAARLAVRRAVASGVLIRPAECSDCGKPAHRCDGVSAIQAHHHAGYARQLDVEWLCPKCHRQHDARALAKQEAKS